MSWARHQRPSPQDLTQINLNRNSFHLSDDFLLLCFYYVRGFQGKILSNNIADIIFQTIKLVFTSAIEEYRSMPRLMTTCTLYIEDKELRIRTPFTTYNTISMFTIRR